MIDVIEALLGQALGKQNINCSSVELVYLTPPSGQTCGDYMSTYITNSGGYVTNPSDSSNCGFCSTATTDQFLGANFNITYAHRWRNIGIVCAFIVFNVCPSAFDLRLNTDLAMQISAIYAFTYLFRIRTGSLFGFLKRKRSTKKTVEAKGPAA